MDLEKPVLWLRTCLCFTLLLLSKSVESDGRDSGDEASMAYNYQNTTATSSKREDIFRKYVHGVVGSKSMINTNHQEGDHYMHMAMMRTDSNGRFFGAKAAMSVHGMYGFAGEKRGVVSGMAIVLSSGDFSTNNYNSIHVGWHFLPDHYGDSDTHFFVLAARSGDPGCFNLEPCSLFVRNIQSSLSPGDKLRPLSRPHGAQAYLNIRIDKDRRSGDWWVYTGPKLQDPVGYFPKYYFSTLSDHAESILIGGEVAYRKGSTAPPMGSGYYAEARGGVAASILYPAVQLVPGRYHVDYQTFDLYSDDPKCYTIAGHVVNQKSAVYVGGPAGCADHYY